MRKSTVLVLVAALLGLSMPATAQAPGEPVATQPKINLTLEQRFIIKELIKDLNVPPAPANTETSVGAIVPAAVKLNPMPAEVAAKVPQINRIYSSSPTARSSSSTPRRTRSSARSTDGVALSGQTWLVTSAWSMLALANPGARRGYVGKLPSGRTGFGSTSLGLNCVTVAAQIAA